jgi:hypothetical protein
MSEKELNKKEFVQQYVISKSPVIETAVRLDRAIFEAMKAYEEIEEFFERELRRSKNAI